MGRFHQSGFIGLGPGKGPFAITEQFTFDQGFRDPGAGNGDKGKIASLAVFMDQVGYQFLAGSAFSGDQDVADHLGSIAESVQTPSSSGDFGRSGAWSGI